MAKNNDGNNYFDKYGAKNTNQNRRSSPVSKRSSNRNNVEINNGFEIPLNDDYLIVDPEEMQQPKKPNQNVAARKQPVRNNTNRRNNNKKNNKNKKRHPVLSALLSIFLIIVITGSLVVGAAVFYFVAIMSPSDEILDPSNNLYNLKLQYTSILYAKDSNGKDVELKRLHGTQNRLWVDNKDIPKCLKNAFISCEDKRFREHSGVDWKRTTSAALNLAFHFYSSEQGGSTITQQLVKNITGNAQKTSSRKVQEIKDALYVEENYDKDTILECYLNTIHLGNGVDGVEVAANYYFDKHTSKLSVVESACLAAITNNPAYNEPYKHPDANKKRRNWVIDEMYNNGYITKEQCQKSKNEELKLRKKPSTTLSTTQTVENEEEYNSYFVDAVIDDVAKKLVKEKGYTKEYATEQIYKGGYKIYTTVDLDMQKKLEKVYLNDNYFAYQNGKRPQSAMTIMDYNGNIKAIVGGRGKKKGNRVFNRATNARPTGSAIKPISVYAPAFEYNVITWGSKVQDSPINKLENGVYMSESWPKNFSNSYSYSDTSISYAVQQSLNTIPVKLVQKMTLDTTYKFVTEKMGISTFTRNDGNGHSDLTESSLALGGSVRGITTVELAAAYSTFGNGGMYYEPKTFTKVLDQGNQVVLDETKNKHRAISAGTSGIMCKMLQSVATHGTGEGATFGNWQIMCKTGTTSDNKDRWFVGGTSKYMAACWYGMDDNKVMSHLSPNPAMIIWKAVMSSVHENLTPESFKISSDCQLRKYCTSSGLCARTGCYSYAYGYFKKSYTPFCNIHGGYETGILTGNYDTNSNESYNSATKTTEKTSDKSEKATGTTANGKQGNTSADQSQATSSPQNTTNAPPDKTKATEAPATATKKQE